jgi:predicted HTH transcriptional regulator
METTGRRKIKFEDVFMNENQIKILIVLASKQRRGTSKAAKASQSESFGYLKKRTRVSKETLKNYLEVLLKSGLIQEIVHEGETLFRFNFESAKGKALKKLFQLFGARDD